MSLSLREVALEAGEPVEGAEVVEALVAVVAGGATMTLGAQVARGQLRGLVASTLGRLGWAADELLILNRDDLRLEDLHDSQAFSEDAWEVLRTLELSESQGNTTQQCVDKAMKCHALLQAGLR